MRCHGTEYFRPFASQQIYTGDLFEQMDQARDFVLGKIDRAIGTRESGSIAPATYELPPDAITEAIVNAIAHRDYNSNASVEVRLFADRLEVWNPGTLPGTLSLESLQVDHPSVPFNPLIAESLYLARYIEKAGSGTQRMIELCLEAGLPKPDYEIRQGFFVLTLWKDWLTPKIIESLELTDRQKKAVQRARNGEQFTNKSYQEFFNVSKPTASRDLDELVIKNILARIGKTGKGTYYILNTNGLKKGSIGSRYNHDIKGS